MQGKRKRPTPAEAEVGLPAMAYRGCMRHTGLSYLGPGLGNIQHWPLAWSIHVLMMRRQKGPRVSMNVPRQHRRVFGPVAFVRATSRG